MARNVPLQDRMCAARGRFPCPQCSKVFALNRYLTKHLRRHVKRNNEPPESIAGNLTCHTCGKDFDRLSHLHRHQLVHLGVREWACPFCALQFTQKVHLVKHLRRIHSEEKDANVWQSIELNHWRRDSENPMTSSGPAATPLSSQLPSKELECERYSDTFSSNSELKRHMTRRHRDVRCGSCGSTFDGSRELKMHEMRKREEVHRCENCKATFSRSTELNTHRNSCVGVHSFECIPCGSAFAQCTQLDRHVIRQHFVPGSCPRCAQHFISPALLRDHCLAKHSLNICGYCTCEDISKEHVNRTHWRRIRRPIETTNQEKQLPSSSSEPATSTGRVQEVGNPERKLETKQPKSVQVLLRVPAGVANIELSGRLPEDLLERHPTIANTESISVSTSTREREVLLFLDILQDEAVYTKPIVLS